MRRLLCALLLVAATARADWQALAPGLDLGVFDGPPTDVGDGKIRVLRIDPARYDLALMNASAPGEGSARTAKEWAKRAGAVAAINASMFRDDRRTSVSLMRTRAHVNNPRLSKDRTMLAFDGAPSPPALLDRDCDDFDGAAVRYGTLVQSIRMVGCKRTVAWKRQPDKRWSTAAIGVDDRGRVLFIHARSPWPVHDLAARLLALPIGLARAMYVEGGPEATLYIHAGKREEELVGSFETGFWENDGNTEAWALPNVVVAVPKKR